DDAGGPGHADAGLPPALLRAGLRAARPAAGLDPRRRHVQPDHTRSRGGARLPGRVSDRGRACVRRRRGARARLLALGAARLAKRGAGRLRRDRGPAFRGRSSGPGVILLPRGNQGRNAQPTNVRPVLSLDLIARLIVALVLLWAGVSKLVSRDSSFLAPYGVPVRWRGAARAALTGIELATGVVLLAGVQAAAVAAVALGAVFVASLAGVRARGIRRLRCGCFGARERSTDLLLGRALLFTGIAAFGAFADVEVGRPSGDALVVAALVVLGLAVLLLGALVLALYRQVGVLTMRLGPGVALELAEEGPAVGDVAPELDG